MFWMKLNAPPLPNPHSPPTHKLWAVPKRKQAIASTNANKHLSKHTCTWSSWTAPWPFVVFHIFFKDQRKKDGRDFEPDTMSSFRKTPAWHWLANTYSALSCDRINFFDMTHKPHNKHFISLDFSVRTLNHGSSFFFNRRSVIWSMDRKLG